MIDFTLSPDDFAATCKIMTRSRTAAAAEVVDLLCSAGTVKFVVTGRDSTCAAVVAAPGKARFPLKTLAKLGLGAETFGNTPLRIRIEDGRIRVNSMSVSLPGITVTPISDRAIDIPDDASIRDILALQFLFTPEELIASDLNTRFQKAQTAGDQAVGFAVQTLATFGIPEDAVQSLVVQALKTHAQRLQPMLKPDLASTRIN